MQEKQWEGHLRIFVLCTYVLRQNLNDSRGTITAGSKTCSDNFKREMFITLWSVAAQGT